MILLISTDVERAEQMTESYFTLELLMGTTISVMAMDNDDRIKNETTMPMNDIIPKTIR